MWLLCTGAAFARSDEASELVVRFHSAVFANDRTIRVLLPPGYARPDRASRRYPVLYFNDGQDLFDPHLSTFHNGGSYLLRDRMQALYAENAVRPLIIVGIDNAGHSLRPNEYLPWPEHAAPHAEPRKFTTFRALAPSVTDRLDHGVRPCEAVLRLGLDFDRRAALLTLQVST